MIFHDGKVILYDGDCLDILDTLPENSIDSVVTDPPYHLTSIVKRFGKENSTPAQFGTDGVYARSSRGFMGKKWDGGDIAFQPELWAKVLRVLKPGGYMVAFSGTRTYHRMVCGIEDAGFEIRDQLAWVYGTGFPKSYNISKAIDKAAGAERDVVGRRSENVVSKKWRALEGRDDLPLSILNITAPATDEAKEWEGWGTALKPAQEPICLARKPISEKSISANVLKWGTGALNINGCRVGRELLPEQKAGQSKIGTFERENMITPEPFGRWPANFLHDGSEEVVRLFPAGENGSAARFFYCAKANHQDRMFSKHPTVKPLNLMKWLVRLVTPPNGTILDPFAGTGTTGQAALLEGFKVILIEREQEYREDIERRMKMAFEKKIHKEKRVTDDNDKIFVKGEEYD